MPLISVNLVQNCITTLKQKLPGNIFEKGRYCLLTLLLDIENKIPSHREDNKYTHDPIYTHIYHLLKFTLFKA